MDRPEIKDFIPNASLSEIHSMYRKNPVLWGYIQALDVYIDSIEDKAEKLPISGVSGSSLNDSKEAIAEARGIWSTGKRLEPIKMVSFATGMNLKEAKKWCEDNFR
jgi:ribosomal protein L7/L12